MLLPCQTCRDSFSFAFERKLPVPSYGYFLITSLVFKHFGIKSNSSHYTRCGSLHLDTKLLQRYQEQRELHSPKEDFSSKLS